MRAGDRLAVMSELITCVVPPSAGAGRLLVVEAAVPPGGGPPPLHRHPPDEVFHTIAGRICLFTQSAGTIERRELAAGETGFVPGGVPHTFRNFEAAEARVLLTFTPGEMMAAFFSATGRAILDGAEPAEADRAAEVERVLRLGAELGLETLTLVPA